LTAVSIVRAGTEPAWGLRQSPGEVRLRRIGTIDPMIHRTIPESPASVLPPEELVWDVVALFGDRAFRS